MANESWQTSSGLLDDYEFEVNEAWFGEDEENEDERIFLFLRGNAYIDDELESDEHQERYSVGSNWEVVDGGAAVENATGKNRFNRQAGLGRLIDALVGLGDDVAEGLGSRGEAYEASVYVGLNMHMERSVVSRWKNDDGEDVAWELPLPVSASFGEMEAAEEAPAAKPAVKKPVARKPVAKAGGSPKVGKSQKQEEPTLRGLVIEFAAQFDAGEHDEFVDQVLDEEKWDAALDIHNDDELHAEVLDPESDLWTEAHS